MMNNVHCVILTSAGAVENFTLDITTIIYSFLPLIFLLKYYITPE